MPTVPIRSDDQRNLRQIRDQAPSQVQSGKSGIRPFVEGDLPTVVELYQKVFSEGKSFSSRHLEMRFRKVLLQNPWYDESLPSLVYEKDGRIVGFLGIVVRHMLLGNEPVRVAVSNHFMVDPDSRTTLAGVELLRRFFSGPQDLSIAEAGEASRKVWVALKGGVSPIYSLHWTRILRPSQYAVYQLQKRGQPAPLAWMAKSLGSITDAIVSHLPSSPFRQISQDPEEELSPEELLYCLSDVTKTAGFRPVYDLDSLKWLLNIVADKTLLGTLRKVVVRNSEREPIGWYIYYLNPGGISRVIQMGAKPGCFEKVLHHLFYHAWRQGALAVFGRLDSRYVKELSDQHCVMRWGSWMLVHSKRPELLQAVNGTDAFFTPLEGEWWISVEGEPVR